MNVEFFYLFILSNIPTFDLYTNNNNEKLSRILFQNDQRISYFLSVFSILYIVYVLALSFNKEIFNIQILYGSVTGFFYVKYYVAYAFVHINNKVEMYAIYITNIISTILLSISVSQSIDYDLLLFVAFFFIYIKDILFDFKVIRALLLDKCDHDIHTQLLP